MKWSFLRCRSISSASTLEAACDFWQQRDGETRRHCNQIGETILMPAGQESRWRSRNATTTLHLLVQPEFIRRIALETGRGDMPEMVNCFGASDPQLLHLGLALKAEAETGGRNGLLFAECLSTAVAVHLLQQYSSPGRRIALQAPGLSPVQVRQVDEYVRENLSAGLSLGEIAGVVHLSPFHFARLWKQATGSTIHQFVIGCRIQAAKRLLRQDSLSIGQVASEVGFAQQSHLAGHFRRATGLSPTEFRRDLSGLNSAKARSWTEDSKNLTDTSSAACHTLCSEN